MNLDADELLSILARGEGRQVEFKRGLPGPEKTARTLCAFANTSGGMLIVGVTDRGEVYGLERPREVATELRRICAEVLQPPLKAEVVPVRVEGEHTVVCSVPHSGQRPHTILREGRDPEVTIRVGSSNRRASGATLEALRAGTRSRKGLDALERRVLDWVAGTRRGHRPEGEATIRAFAKSNNIGVQRARRTFTQLERRGLLVGHGFGAKRVYSVT